MPTLTVDTEASVDFLVRLLNIPSPTGYTTDAIAYCEEAFGSLGLPNASIRRTRKGGLLITWPGEGSGQVGVTAHTDTLGLMVKEIKANGRLKTARIGGLIYSSADCENVTVRTFDGRLYRGTFLLNEPASHVNRDIHTTVRDENSMEVRLDVKTFSAHDTRALGVEVGDYIFVDPRVEVTDTGFIRSRFLDNKASVACIFGALKALQNSGRRPAATTTILISNYEEVGHGGAADWPADLDEYLCVDMAAIGGGQNSDEYNCTLCMHDSGGPYHFDLTAKLRRLAQSHDIPYKMDLYPYYASDGTAYWRAGGSAAVALIGPGVSGSHGYERTHIDALNATAALIGEYLLTPGQG